MTRLRWLLLFTAVQFCIAAPRAHHVMLSWKPSGQPWHFAFYSTLPLPYSHLDVGKPDMVIVGLSALKQRLSRQQPWRDIVWRDLIGSRTYPDVKTPDDILAFAKAHSVNLEAVPTIID
jgi:hypothetical protein